MKKKNWHEINMQPERVAYRKDYYKKYWETHPKNAKYKKKNTKRGFKKGHVVSIETRNKLRLANLGKKRGNYPLEWRQNISKAHLKIREKSHLWKGGITPKNTKLRNLLKYRLWREAVFERDDWICQFCKKRSKAGERVLLNAHHIKPFFMFPELSFEVDNGITLCRLCHSLTQSYLNRYYKVI